jgi:hypothetical protein
MSKPKTCKCAAHSYAECICGAWDDLNPHTLKRERDEARECLREMLVHVRIVKIWDIAEVTWARWRRAAGIDTANKSVEGRETRAGKVT